ncbi:MAG: NUDIX hydrolase [Deltaproteobacteria bacterium]|nr:NUDIX hydrolase [Deltaproteobacteria bacterium]
MPFSYAYPRPSVTCDAVVFTLRADDLAVLLIRRKEDPFKGAWALPGGFVNENESLERAAARELYEETGLSGMRLEQLGAFGDPGRDPRGHTVSVAWMTFRATPPSLSPGDDALEAEWCPMRNLELGEVTSSRSVPPPPPGSKKVTRRSVPPRAARIELAFDHAKILTKAYRRLCRHLDDPVRDAAFDIVPPRFTLVELKRMYEIILGRSLAPRVMKQFFVDRALVVPASTKPAAKAAAQLYRWNRR